MNPEQIVAKLKEILENEYTTPKTFEWLFDFLVKNAAERKKKTERSKEYQKQYYMKNKKQLDSRHTQYRNQHPEYRQKVRANSAEYRREDKS